MTSSVNSVILSGYLEGDPEYLQTKNGNPMVRFTIDVYESFRSQERDVERTYHVPVAHFGNLPNELMANLRIGSHVTVQGRITSNDYTDKHGVRRSSININASTIDVDLGNANAPNYAQPGYPAPQASYPPQPQQQPQQPQPQQQQGGFFATGPQYDTSGIPF